LQQPILTPGALVLNSPHHEDDPAERSVAVIDVGTSAVRMTIAEITGKHQVRILERLSQAISLGKDAFTKGLIQHKTIEDCVRVLRSYRHILNENQITQPEQLRVVATSAVREAQNRLAFLDRVYSATGFQIESIDEAEINRATYLGMLPFLSHNREFQHSTNIITEVGGGSTDLLVLQQENVTYAHSYRLGSLRLREILEAYRAPRTRMRQIMESQIDRTIEAIRSHLPPTGPYELIAAGGDVRFAASQLVNEWKPEELGIISVSELESFTDRILTKTDDELMHRYRLTFADAEMLGPALLTYARLARSLKLTYLRVSNFNLRDALLNEMATLDSWTPEFVNQIEQSALSLGRKFQFDEQHGRHVSELCRALFRELQDEHQLAPHYETLLILAALLHEIGLFVNNRGHHKHAMYLISNSELFGLGQSNLQLVALVARYHRRAVPKSIHQGYASLERDQRIAVSKMAAMLRVADSLDASRSQRVRHIKCTKETTQFVISIQDVDDLSLEQLVLKQKGNLFEGTFGKPVHLRPIARRTGC
jgi:exopolyphosphatase/guanosine-5'-triphosphate,3'-diphosphate pyrophosphatase